MSNTEQTGRRAERADRPEQADRPESGADSGAGPGAESGTGSTGAAGESSLGAAGERLSTGPAQDPEPATLPALGLVGWIRWFWRQLTSMRVALILLFLLSLGAIPGSLIPQNGVDETKVSAFKEAHETLTPIYEKLQLFDVYSSVWFSAIYILLFVSLIGCIVPRTHQFVGQLRSRPPGAPRRLTRLPAYATWRTEATPAQVREAGLKLLRKRRFRVHAAGDAVAAEKGYLREFGNLLFHISLIVMLLAFAAGQLFRAEGGKLVVEGDGFANTLSQYDDFRSGSLFALDDLGHFSFELRRFTGTYEATGPQRGTPRTFEAEVTYAENGGPDKEAVIRVNEPLRVAGARVYLIEHGYAPVVTVRDGKGKIVSQEAVPLLPLDANVTSQGVVKVKDGYRDKNGKRDQLGIPLFFVPTFAGEGQGEMFSVFPALVDPRLSVSAYHGDLRADSGVPQNVYQLDTSKMKQFKDERGEILKKQLKPGETFTLPDGAGSITFEKEIKEWASFQISQQPGNGWALAGAVAAILGLTASLFIQRRRVWVRAVEGPDGVTVVETAGLGRGESAKLPEELAELVAALHSVAPTAPTAPAAPDAPDAPAESAVREDDGPADGAAEARADGDRADGARAADDPAAEKRDAAARTPAGDGAEPADQAVPSEGASQ
ncbi:cytochrome c biogenesis protein ResB [Streptomyces fradiae]|uniref:cytochrome c biogenesis protein ResB n=1 Tax=Streptomyces fradiae TaxID=1906 RepID=UPI002942CA29|nr:cytochrome c biogenesis protein ResB [Streptomyces fradiae]WOI63073.1 cytochrome c biogenesis protein ResB [Streptomyces fradiae]